MPKIYTVKEVAEILGFSTNTIYTFLKEKRIKGVRVGAGRFRIPEEELTRVLHLSKRPAPAIAPLSVLPRTPELIARRQTSSISQPHLTDWFIAISTIVTGVALFLFNTAMYQTSAGMFVPIIRVVLILSGVGYLTSSIKFSDSGWHRVFGVIIGCIALASGYGFFRDLDVDGAVLYGVVGFTILVSVFTPLRAAPFMGVLTTALGLGTLVGAAIIPNDIHLISLAKLSGFAPGQILIVIGVVAVINLTLYWVGFVRQQRIIFSISCITAAITFIWVAALYGELMYWARAFFYVVLSFFCLFLPLWRMLDSDMSTKRRLAMHGFFAGITSLLVLSIVVVYTLHITLWDQRHKDFDNKIAIGQNTVQAAFASVQSSMVTAASNQTIVSHLGKTQVENLAMDAKIIYDGNPLIRRLVFLDAKGNGVALYPYGIFDLENYAFREYFVRARDTRIPYISNIYEARADGLRRPVVTITVPLTDVKGVFIGVMSASVNLEKLGVSLQQIAREDAGEYFTVVDSEGQYIIHPQDDHVGEKAEEAETAMLGQAGNRGVTESALPDGTMGLVAYGPMTPLHWGISLQIPAGSVIALNALSLLIVFGTLFLMFVLSVAVLFILRFRWVGQGENGA